MFHFLMLEFFSPSLSLPPILGTLFIFSSIFYVWKWGIVWLCKTTIVKLCHSFERNSSSVIVLVLFILFFCVKSFSIKCQFLPCLSSSLTLSLLFYSFFFSLFFVFFSAKLSFRCAIVHCLEYCLRFLGSVCVTLLTLLPPSSLSFSPFPPSLSLFHSFFSELVFILFFVCVSISILCDFWRERKEGWRFRLEEYKPD